MDLGNMRDGPSPRGLVSLSFSDHIKGISLLLIRRQLYAMIMWIRSQNNSWILLYSNDGLNRQNLRRYPNARDTL